MEQVEKPSLLGIVTSPKTQFERIRENPKVLVAFIVVTLMTIIGMMMLATGLDLLEQDPSLSSLGEEEFMVVAMISQIGFVIVGVLAPIIVILISSAIYLAIGKMVRSDVTFKQLFSMNTYIFFISAISILLNGLLYLFFQVGSTEVAITSLNSLVAADGFLGLFLNSIEVFNIWTYILTAIGLQVVAKFSKGLSWSIVIVFYIISLVIGMVGLAASSIGV